MEKYDLWDLLAPLIRGSIWHMKIIAPTIENPYGLEGWVEELPHPKRPIKTKFIGKKRKRNPNATSRRWKPV